MILYFRWKRKSCVTHPWDSFWVVDILIIFDIIHLTREPIASWNLATSVIMFHKITLHFSGWGRYFLLCLLTVITKVITATSIITKVNKSLYVTYISTSPFLLWVGGYISPHRFLGQIHYVEFIWSYFIRRNRLWQLKIEKLC